MNALFLALLIAARPPTPGDVRACTATTRGALVEVTRTKALPSAGAFTSLALAVALDPSATAYLRGVRKALVWDRKIAPRRAPYAYLLPARVLKIGDRVTIGRNDARCLIQARFPRKGAVLARLYSVPATIDGKHALVDVVIGTDGRASAGNVDIELLGKSAQSVVNLLRESKKRVKN